MVKTYFKISLIFGDGGKTSLTNSFLVHLDGKQDEAEENLANDVVGGEASPHNTSDKVDTACEKEEEDPPEKPAISKLT